MHSIHLRNVVVDGAGTFVAGAGLFEGAERVNTT